MQPRWYATLNTEFQSLTGRLKTPVPRPERVSSTRFQSLTGRLKTAHLAVVRRAERAFQSLTGRLKTRIGGSIATATAWVSIPHR
mgnify:CR=1 FL=1